MSIIRVSALKGAVHGIKSNGAFVHGDYDRRRLTGRTERLSEPRTPGGTIEPGQPFPAREARERGLPTGTGNLAHLIRRRGGDAVSALRAGPAVVFVHGFLFDPRDSWSPDPEDSDNPHARLYHYVAEPDDPVRHHTTSWPVGLGFGPDDTTGRDGTIFAFGWHSRPGFASSLITRFQNFYARAYENAEQAAWNLVTCLHVLVPLLPHGKPLDFFCHSLGSRVVIRAIALMAKHGRLDLIDRIDRVIILGGAEYVVEARHMLQRLGRIDRREAIAFYNVVSRENDVLDKLGENFGPRTFGNSNVIGHNGLDVEDPDSLGPSWLDLQIDGLELAKWLSDNRGMTVTGDNPDSVWDHWYYFTDPGNMALYRAILRDRDNWRIAELKDAGIPKTVSKRRSILAH